MTDRDNMVVGKYVVMRSTILTTAVIVTITLIAIISTITSINGSIYAQMIGDHSGLSNMSLNTHKYQQEKMINGTINLEQTIIEAIDSKVNTSLNQAITTAEKSVGNNSFALAAFGADQGGYLTYMIILGTPGTEFHNVIVDPGNGQILSSERSSQSEIEEKHLAHSTAIVQDAVSGVGSYGLRALRH